MDPLLTEFKNDYRELLLSFLWRQWSALGVAGYAETKDAWAIDPEALLLFSCTLGRCEPRLFDEILDWLNTNGDSISIQRLKTMLTQGLFSGGDVLAAVAGCMAAGHSLPKWKSLAQNVPTNNRVQSLFYQKTGEAMPSFGQLDATFKRYGFQRGKIEFRQHTQHIRIIRNTGLFFKLRYLWGINARSEIILYLLTHDSGHPRKISRETYYFQKTVQDALVDMVQSGLVYVRPVGNEKHYWLKTEKWLDFLSIDSEEKLIWINWPLMLSALEIIWRKINSPDFSVLSPLMQASELRALMREVRPKIEDSGFAKALSDEKLYLGDEYTRVFLRDIENLLGKNANT